jgi:hypothetical protein
MNRRFAKPVAGILVALVLLFALGFRWGHPKDGLANALGSAQSGIVVYQKSSNLSVGSKVVSAVDGPAKSPVLGVVTSISGDRVVIQTGAKLAQVKKNQISGKLFVVVPFIGSIFSIVGL